MNSKEYRGKLKTIFNWYLDGTISKAQLVDAQKRIEEAYAKEPEQQPVTLESAQEIFA